MWFHLLLICVALGVYCWDRPLGGPNGGTLLGVTYGILATVGILILLWYGRRKRDYFSRFTTLRGWLAVHVWLGLGLLILVPLHSGFQFNWNIHTAAYLLLVLTVLTGVWGAWIFIVYAPEVASHRGGGTVKDLLEQLDGLEKEIEKLAAGRSTAFQALKGKLDQCKVPSCLGAVFSRAPKALDRELAAKLLAGLPNEEVGEGQKQAGLLFSKAELIRKLHKEVATQTTLKLWLYTHVPLAAAMAAAVLFHIFYVLYYRW